MAASLIPREDPDLHPDRESTRLARVGQREYVRRLPPRHALTVCEGNGEIMCVTPDINQQRELLNDMSAFGDVVFHPILVPHNTSAADVESPQKRRKLGHGAGLRSPADPYERRREVSRPFGWIGHVPRSERSSDGLPDVPQSLDDSMRSDERPPPTSTALDLTAQRDRERDVFSSGGEHLNRSILGLAPTSYVSRAWSALASLGGGVERDYREGDLKHNHELHTDEDDEDDEPPHDSDLDKSIFDRARGLLFREPPRTTRSPKRRRRQMAESSRDKENAAPVAANPLHTLGRGSGKASSGGVTSVASGQSSAPGPDARFNLTFTTGFVQETFECPVIAMACHPVRPEVAFATHDDRVSFYEFTTGKISTLCLSSELQQCVSDVKYNPSGTQLATACLNGVCLWTFRHEPKMRSEADATSTDASFQKFADLNATLSQGEDTRGAWMEFLPQKYAAAHSMLAWSSKQQAVSGISFSPCGRFLAAWHDESPSAAIWAIDRNPPTMVTYSVPHLRLPLTGYERHISEIRWSQAFGNNNALVVSRVTPFGVGLPALGNREARSKAPEYSDWRVDIVGTDNFETQSAFPLPGPVHSSAWHSTRQKFVLAVGPRLVEQFEFREKTDLSNRERFFKFPDGKLVDERAFRPSAARYVDGKPYYRPYEHEKLGEPFREKYPGGDVHLVRWSADARRLAISFKPNLDKNTNNCSELIAVFNTNDSELHPATLLGYIRGPCALNDAEKLTEDFLRQQHLKFSYDNLERRQAQDRPNAHLYSHSEYPLRDSYGYVINYPVHMEFSQPYERGSLLVVVWLGGQVTSYPMMYECGGVRPTKGDNFVENLVPNPHIRAQKTLFGLAKPAADFLNRTLGLGMQ